MTRLEAGWGFPTTAARKAHYFPAGEVRSLCRKYGRHLPVDIQADDPEEDHSDVDCTTCERKLRASAPNPFAVGDMALHVGNQLDSRPVAAVSGNQIQLKIGTAQTDWLPAANYRKINA